MKKILMVCEAFGGGVFSYVSQLCNDMCDHFEVYLAYSTRKQTPNNFKVFLDSRVNLIEVKSFSKISIPNFFNYRQVIRELRAIEQEINPDIIHLHSSLAGAFGRIAFKNREKSVIYTPHGYAHVLMGTGVKCKAYFFAEKILGRKSEAITLTCCKSEDDEAKKLTNRTAYIETGININDLSENLKNVKPRGSSKFTVYTLGRVCKQKQPELFNEIASLVPEARFVWIGGGELENQLTSPNVEITGWKSRKEALGMAMSADAFILCSLGEAIAMSLLENMYIRKLILVSNVMGNKSVINDGENGYVCSSPSEYAEKIKLAMNEFPYQLVDNAYNDVISIYNTEKMKQKYISFYNRVLEEMEDIK